MNRAVSPALEADHARCGLCANPLGGAARRFGFLIGILAFTTAARALVAQVAPASHFGLGAGAALFDGAESSAGAGAFARLALWTTYGSSSTAIVLELTGYRYAARAPSVLLGLGGYSYRSGPGASSRTGIGLDAGLAWPLTARLSLDARFVSLRPNLPRAWTTPVGLTLVL